MSYVEFGGGVVSAVERACETDLRTALRLVARYSAYWWSRGLEDEAAAAAERVLSMLGRSVPVGLDEEYLLAVLHGAASAEQEQIELAQQIVDATVGPFRYSATVLLWCLVFGPFEPVDVVEDVLKRNEHGDAWTRAAVELCRGYPGLTRATEEEAAQALRTALGRFRMLEDAWGTFLALSALQQSVGAPLELTTEALGLAEQLGLDEQVGLLLCRRGDLYRVQGKLDAARHDYSMALVLGERAELPETVAAAHIGLARAARCCGHVQTAQAHLAAVLELTDLEDAHYEARHELEALQQVSASA
jgi:tetratricopeptide (TPR) repeat protein